jgi:curved DNA-binding protein CbpA
MLARSEQAPAASGRAAEGVHRAPRGRGFEGQFYLFCLDHVRQFNASYNYFDGMSNAEVEAYQKDSVIGHRPTWKAGANAWAHGTRHGGSSAETGGRASNDPHAFFSWRSGRPRAGPGARPSPLEAKPRIAKSSGRAGQIKSRFKELVKRHHPDANGGDTRPGQAAKSSKPIIISSRLGWRSRIARPHFVAHPVRRACRAPGKTSGHETTCAPKPKPPGVPACRT